MAQLDMPDEVYNWYVSQSRGHSHCTHYRGEVSTVYVISASVLQSSSIGPVFYVVNIGDFQAVTPEKVVIKFADGTYLIIYLKVNPTIYAEIVFVHNKRKTAVQLPLPMPNITRISIMNILAITFTNSLYDSEHIQTVIGTCAQLCTP